MKYKELVIVHTICHGEWGGMERRVVNESSWMCSRGHRVVIAAPEGTPVHEKSIENGWETHSFSFDKTGFIENIIRLRSLFKRLKPHVVNTHGNMDTKITLLALTGLNVPCVILSRHITSTVNRSVHNRLLYGRMCRYVFTTAGCTTRQIVNDLGVARDRIFTMPSGVTPPGYMPEKEAAKKQLAGELGLDPSSKFIGYVGRISREKGVFCLIDAFDLIKDRYPQYHLVLVGDGYYLSEFEEKIARARLANRVHITGYRSNTWPYYRAFEFKSIGSLEDEGIPQAVLEAMLAGCPVIGTRVGGIPDVIDDQETGVLIPPGNPDMLARAMCDLMDNPEKIRGMGKQSSETASALHTIDVMGEKILEIYGRTL